MNLEESAEVSKIISNGEQSGTHSRKKKANSNNDEKMQKHVADLQNLYITFNKHKSEET